MNQSTPTTEPSTIIPGDTVKWTRSLPDYPANDSWVLAYEMVSSSHRYELTATANGSDHLVTIPAATSAGYEPGSYDWRARASKAGEVYTVGTGRMQVKKSFASAADMRSQARRTLEAIEATLEGRASSATAEYEIAGRKIKYIPLPELLTLRDQYRQDIAREDASARTASGLPNPGRIFVRHV